MKLLLKATLGLYLSILISCGQTQNNPEGLVANDDNSASGVLGSSIGSALTSSTLGGSVARLKTLKQKSIAQSIFEFILATPVQAINTCPSIKSQNGGGCTSIAKAVSLKLDSCSELGVQATWSGVLNVGFSSGDNTLNCGSVPTPASATLYRQFVISPSNASPASGVRMSPQGIKVIVDDSMAGLISNYQADALDGTGPSAFSLKAPNLMNGGGGEFLSFNASGDRTNLTLVKSVVATNVGLPKFNYTILGTLNLSASGDPSSPTWFVNAGTLAAGICTGGVSVYHNQAKVLGSSCLQNVSYNNTCCTPISGTITTSFAITSNSGTNAITNFYNGKTESITFTGCGQANYSSPGVTASIPVTLPHCL